MSVLFGSNSRVFDPMNDAGITVRTFRAYRDEYNFVPTVWPSKRACPRPR